MASQAVSPASVATAVEFEREPPVRGPRVHRKRHLVGGQCEQRVAVERRMERLDAAVHRTVHLLRELIQFDVVECDVRDDCR